jgi:hypothetical protein
VSSEEAEDRLVDSVRILLLHRVRGARDVNPLGARQQPLQVFGQPDQDGGAPRPGHQQGGRPYAPHVVLVQWREARAEELRAQRRQVLARLLRAFLGQPLVCLLAEHPVGERLQRLIVIASPESPLRGCDRPGAELEDRERGPRPPGEQGEELPG